MKLILGVILLFSMTLQAQNNSNNPLPMSSTPPGEIHVTFHNETAGNLGTAMIIAGYSLPTITHLTVTGQLNADDLAIINGNMSVVSEIDLSGSILEGSKIPKYAFSSKRTLTKFIFPPSIKEIGSMAFSGTNLLGPLHLPESLQIIGIETFRDNVNLSGTLKLPDNLTSIGSVAFYNANISGVLTIPASVTSIGSSCFAKCSEITSLSFPISIITIGYHAFRECKKLTRILTRNATPPILENNVFDGVDKTACELVVPSGSKMAYQLAPQWGAFTTITEVDMSAASITSDQPGDVACENELVTFTAGGGTSYEFFVNGVSQGAASPINTFQHNSVNDFIVSVRVIDGNNYEVIETVNITISKPVAGLTATLTEICDGQSVTLKATGGAQYVFFKDGINVQGPDPSETYVDNVLTDGQVVTVKVIDAAGCEDTHLGIPVTMNPNPTVTLTSSDFDHIICEGESVTFTGSGADAYEFYVNGISAQGPSGTDTYTTTSLINGDEVSVLVTNSATMCTSLSSTLKYTVNSNPTATLTANPSGNIIAGTSVVFTAGGGTDYEFFINGISVQALGNGNTYTSNALVNGDVVAVNVFNAAGCVSTETITMTVLDGIQILNVLSSGIDHCQGDASTVSVYIATPQNGITFDLIRTSDNGIIGTITHDGTNAVQWDNIPGTDEYRIEGYYSSVPADRLEMNNRITVTENILPKKFPLVLSGYVEICNEFKDIKLSNSEKNVDYNLLLNGALVETVSGDGNPISFSAQSIIGVYTVQAVTAFGCTVLMDGSLTINSNGSDVPFNVYSLPADGRYCAGNAGVEIRLDGSLDNTVSYVVYRDGVDTGVSVQGNSGDVSLGTYTTDGIYTVRAHSGSGCEFPMNGSVDVQTLALPLTHNLEATNGGRYCFGDGTGLQIWLAGQELGVEYQLYLNDIAQGARITGTVTDNTTPLFFSGTYLTPGTYSVAANTPGVSCQVSMNNTLDIVLDPLPMTFDVTSDGDYCTGSVTYLRLNGSEKDVEYRWEREGDAAIGPWTDGTGGLLSFEITGTDTYYIVGRKKDGVTSCTSEMNGRFAIAEKPYADLTKSLSVKAGTGTDCSTGSIVIVENSEAGIVYELVKGGVRTSNVVTGDGTDVEFPNAIVNIAATYNAYASLNGCEDLLIDDVLINAPGAINQYSVTGAGDICNGDPGQQFGLSSTEAGVTYTLYLADSPGSGTGTAKGMIMGDGLAQLFPLVNEEGEYFVIGDNGVDCAIEMLNRVTLSVNPLPVAFKMMGSGFFCDPLEGAEIGINGSEAGVRYTLQYNDGTGIHNLVTAIGVAGGDAIIFGNYTDLGTYKCVASTEKGCTGTMNGEVTVQQTSKIEAPEILLPDGDSHCSSTNGVRIGIRSSSSYIVYELIDATNNRSVEIKSGNGYDFYFNNLIDGNKDYLVRSALTNSSCTPTDVVLSINKFTYPYKYAVKSDASNVCGTSGTTLQISGSDVGCIYQLFENGTHVTTADKQGTGQLLSWMVSSSTRGTVTYEIRAISGGSCDLTMGTVTINYQDPPATPVVLLPDGTSYCDFNTGVRVGIEASVAGVGYQLIETAGGTSIGFIQGDGNDKYFTGLVSGNTEYIVEARDNSSGCINNSSAFTITANTSANSYAVTSDVANTCTSNSVIISLGGSDIGVNYELNTDGVPSGTLIPGTGSNLSWFVTEAVDGAVIYEVIANPSQACELSMGTIEVTYNLSPNVFNMVSEGGNTEYCADESGIQLGLDGSQNNIGYRLYNLANEVVDYKTGDGTGFYFINVHASGTYRVDAVDFGAGCVSNMTGSITLVENSLPRTDIAMEPDNGPATVTEITLVNPETGISYQLFKDGVEIGSPIVGPNNSFGMPTSMGVYTVRATNITTGCRSILTDQTILDSQNIDEKEFRSAKPVVDDPYCPNEARTIRLLNSQPDVVYTLIRDGVKLSGKTGVGNGNDIEIVDDMPLDNDRANGMLTYGIFAEYPGTSISITFTKTVRIFAWPSQFDAVRDELRIKSEFSEGTINLASNDLPAFSYYVDPVGHEYDYSWAVIYDFIKKAPDAGDDEPYFGDVSLASGGTVLSYTKHPDHNRNDSVAYFINLLGCGPTYNDTATVSIIVDSDISTNINKAPKCDLTIYPNPATSYVLVKNPNGLISSVKLYGSTGKLVAQTDASSAEITMNLEHLAKGIYLLEIESEGKHYTEKLVIN